MIRKKNITEYDLNKAIGNLLNEGGIGFVKTYETEVEDELNEFINVVCGLISTMAQTKSFSDDVLTNRLYSLLADGGELQLLTQELIDLLETLPDKPLPLDPKDYYRNTNGGFKPNT